MHRCSSSATHGMGLLELFDDDDARAIGQIADAVHEHGALAGIELSQMGRHPLLIGASGRALLAFLREATIDEIIRRLDQPEAMRRRIEGIRQLGYALSHDEIQQGVHGLGAPILDDTGHAVASMAILTPTTRANRLPEYTDALLATTAELSRALQGDGAGG